MKLLVLGGTKFLGRHAVDAALAGGHNVTIFTRGQTNPELFPGVERLRGDRDGDLDALRGGSWDGVVDTSGYVPRIVRQSAELLHDRVGRYVFVSSISVYDDFSSPPTETSAVAELEDPATEEIEENYGALKAACEGVVEEIYGDRSARVRAGLIVGPHDPTDRFTYWPRRIALGGEVLGPGDPDAPVQFIDARDLAAWLVNLALEGPGGTYNAHRPRAAADVPATARRHARDDRLRRQTSCGSTTSACARLASSRGPSSRFGSPTAITRGWRAPTSRARSQPD